MRLPSHKKKILLASVVAVFSQASTSYSIEETAKLCKNPNDEIRLTKKQVKDIDKRLLFDGKFVEPGKETLGAMIIMNLDSSVYSKLGFRNEDILVASDEGAIRKPVEALNTMARLSERKLKCIVLERKNATHVIRYLYQI